MADGPNHLERANQIKRATARFIAGEPLSESDRSWVIFALGIAYRVELEFMKGRERTDG